MERDWRAEIQDDTGRKVFEALEDPEWDFRTVSGLSKSTGLSEEEVREVLRKYERFVRKGPVTKNHGRKLYTLRTRDQTAGEIITKLRHYITKSSLEEE